MENLSVEFTSQQLKKLIDMIVADINGLMYDDEDITCDLVGGNFITFSQCEDGIMYDIFEEDPRTGEPDAIDGGCLDCTSDEKQIDILDFISKLAFFSPS